MGKFTIVKLHQFLNNIGITNFTNKNIGDFTVSAASIIDNEKYTNNIFNFQNIPFYIEKLPVAEGYYDNVVLKNQIITLDHDNMLSNIHILLNSNNGDYSTEMLLNCEDSVKKIMTYAEDAFVVGEKSILFKGMHSVVHDHPLNYIDMFIHYQKINCYNKVNSIELPFNPDVHIFAITLEENND
jgi:hypothetical protein